MTKHEGMTKTDFIPGTWVEVYWNFDINSSFGFRHFARSKKSLTRRHWEARKELSQQAS
jgi:hypothetical protein